MMKSRCFRFFTGMLLCLFAGTLSAQQGVSASDEVDQAIERGLEYLARTQRENGSFPEKYGEGGSISALAGMAFLSKGYTPGGARFGENLNRSIDFVLSCADASGYLGAKENGNSKMYCHSICTLFLSEVSGMVSPERQERIDEVLPKAVQLLLDAQNVKKPERDAGGWRYQLKSTDSDMSCSGWALMALRSARLNGGRVPGSAIERAVEYVLRQHKEDEGSFVYQRGGESYAVTLTGAGILCLELCGRHNHPATHRAARYLLRAYSRLERENARCYGTYYTAQGLFQMGGEAWEQFEDWMYRTWIRRQRPNGSWKEEYDSTGYATSLIVLSFTVPYRQLPIYQRDETVDED